MTRPGQDNTIDRWLIEQSAPEPKDLALARALTPDQALNALAAEHEKRRGRQGCEQLGQASQRIEKIKEEG